MQHILRLVAVLVFVGLASLGSSRVIALEVTDQRGKSITLEGPAQRVVYIPPVMWTYLTVDRSSERVVGSSAVAARVIQRGLLGPIFPEAATIPDVTSNGYFAPNIEAVLAQRPEVIFQTVQIGPAVYQPLERIGLPVVGITGVNGEDDFIVWTRLAGEVSGQTDSAARVIRHYENQRRHMDNKLGHLAAIERPKVLHLVSVEPLRPAVGRAFDQAIERAGGRNVAKDLRKFGPVAFEQVLLWDPDVILISGWPEVKQLPADLYASRAWSALKAVKARRVYKVPLGGQRFDGIVEAPLYWQWLAELLHPETMGHDFRALFRGTYLDLYDYPLTEKQIDQTIHLPANRDSEGFSRFLSR